MEHQFPPAGDWRSWVIMGGRGIGDGSSGRWELLQFRNARLLTDKTFLLSHRLRGQLGSDALMPNVWLVGSYFVLLNGNPEQIKLSPAVRDLTQHLRLGPA
jgi:hypothetical protein